MSMLAGELTLDSVRQSDRTAHRKIELQDPADLTYLIAKVSRAAREKIDRHLPPDAAPKEDDRMRAQVEMLVDAYIKQTFDSAKPNLSINGMDSQELEAELAKAREGEEFEAFNTQTVTRIQKLSAEIEEQTLELANLRRNAPAETARRFQDIFAAEDAKMTRKEEAAQEKRVSDAQQTKLDIADVDRIDDLQRNWHRSNAQLNTLTTGLDTTVEKLHRAQQSAAHVSGEDTG